VCVIALISHVEDVLRAFAIRTVSMAITHSSYTNCCLPLTAVLVLTVIEASTEAASESEANSDSNDSSAANSAVVLAAVHSACADISSDVMAVDDAVSDDLSDNTDHLSVQQLLCLLALVQQFPTGYFSDAG
jgi:hypothetical protein